MPDLPLSDPIGFSRKRDWSALGLARILSGAIALISIVDLWHIMSLVFRLWVPSIKVTLIAMGRALQNSDFWDDFSLTHGRVVASFAGASIVGAILGLVIGVNERAEAFSQSLLALARIGAGNTR